MSIEDGGLFLRAAVLAISSAILALVRNFRYQHWLAATSFSLTANASSKVLNGRDALKSFVSGLPGIA